jgi:cell division protein ZapA
LEVPPLSDPVNRIRVDIYGQDFNLRGQSDVGHLQLLAQLVDEKMREIAKNNPRLDYAKLAVLAAVNFADEYFRIRSEYEELLKVLEAEASGGATQRTEELPD